MRCKFLFTLFTFQIFFQILSFAAAAEDFSECGLKNKRMRTRIVNGSNTKLHEYPWMAAVLTTVIDGLIVAQTCGGVLIHPEWVLTAAHCLRNKTAESLYILLGEYDFKVEDLHTELIPVGQIIPHPEFQVKPFVRNDIGLIKLSQPAILTKSIRPICLPPPTLKMEDLYGAKGLALGWGKTSTNGKASHKLKKAGLMIHNISVCQNLYESLFTSGFLCVGGEGKDVCFGDSGGPLMIEDDDKFYTVGVVSYGFDGCAHFGNPSMFTFVPAHLDFIRQYVVE